MRNDSHANPTHQDLLEAVEALDTKLRRIRAIVQLLDHADHVPSALDMKEAMHEGFSSVDGGLHEALAIVEAMRPTIQTRGVQ